ncbi:MAG: hypothetical protein Q8O91_06505 [Candidatus Aminicenantes bacterium]|nr:hypothetical protein [Candidatus Aminicenantes bacterium]
MKKRIIIVLTLFFGVLGLNLSALAQDIAGETKSEVPELTAFHEIIYPIWHTAYPEKDYAALRKYVTDVNKLAAPIFTAKLPGILREKEAKWKEGVAVFKKAVDDYNNAAAGDDDQALLSAAEALHAKYEALVRTLAPVLKEMDVFHQALYVVFHTYLPDKAYDKIRGATADLVTKAEAITKATLPKRLEAKSDAFQKASAELLAAAKTLDASGQAHDHDGMEKGVDAVHAKYEALQKLFE